MVSPVALSLCNGDRQHQPRPCRGGCAEAPPESEPIAAGAQPLYDAGDAIPSVRPEVTTYSLGPNCLGSLVASNVLLTAAHCLDQNDFESGQFKPVDPYTTTLTIRWPTMAQTSYSFGAAPGGPTGSYSVVFHPSWLPGNRAVENDLALIVFEPPISRDEAIPLTITALPHDGSCHDYDVYGRTGHNSNCDGGTGQGILFLADREGCPNALAGLPGTRLLFDDLADPSAGSAICEGDSGSPIFDANGHVASVVSNRNSGDLEAPILGFGVNDNYSWLVPTAIDRDGDGVPAPVDNCDTVNNPGQEDADGDSIGDPCDPCRFVASHVDTDGDGVPDCLDRCPNDDVEPGTLGLCGKDGNGSPIQDTLGDSDCDGLCDGEDNCPFTTNSLQLNNNLLSEDVHNALGANDLGIGDQCEPVLIPDGRPEDGDTHVALSIDTTFFKVRAEVVTREEIFVRPQPSRQANDEPDVLPKTLPQEDVETHFRFCQETPLIRCTADDNVRDDHLELLLPDASAEDDSLPYHRVTMSFAPAQRGATTLLDYDGSTRRFTWDYEADGAFWDATGVVVFRGRMLCRACPAAPSAVPTAV